MKGPISGSEGGSMQWRRTAPGRIEMNVAIGKGRIVPGPRDLNTRLFSAFEGVKMVVAVRADVAIQNLSLRHAPADHSLGGFGIIRFLFLQLLTFHAYGLVGEGG
jgi:hypothetical protein